MKKFVVTTRSYLGDEYMYFIEHDEEPTWEQVDEWLLEHGIDIEDGVCLEEIQSIYEIPEFERL